MDSSISNEHALFDTACRTLAARPAWAEVLLREILQWRLNPKRVPPDVVQQLRAYSDDQLQPMVKQAFGQPIEVSSEERIAELQRLRSIDYSQPADIEAGRAHFANRCANCHRLFGEGKFVGPALDGYERGNLDFWLINMVDPSAEIREGFQSFSVLTSDGRLLTGMIEDRSGTSITLRSADDQRSELPVSDIDELRPLATSLMPDDLLKGLNPQEIRDLMAYLRLGVQQ
jgi:putative heme-binding domain-containing protein